MALRRLHTDELETLCVEDLGFDSEVVSLVSTEPIAAALRRAAAFLCPTSGSALRQAVLQPFRGLCVDQELPDLVDASLELLVAHGDLLELEDRPEGDGNGRILLYAAPPSFVRRASGTLMLLGMAPDLQSSLPHEIQERVEDCGHVRLLPDPDGDLGGYLVEMGFIELAMEVWMKAPPDEAPSVHFDRMNGELNRCAPAERSEELVLLDPESSSRFYPGRWVSVGKRTGRFVARRPQTFGAHLWCYVKMQNGTAEHLLDLTPDGTVRGCDRAWQLQAAIDHVRGEPQVFRVRDGPRGSSMMDFFSPAPMWAQRRWGAIGRPAQHPKGCLFSYRIAGQEIEEEVRFAEDRLSLARID